MAKQNQSNDVNLDFIGSQNLNNLHIQPLKKEPTHPNTKINTHQNQLDEEVDSTLRSSTPTDFQNTNKIALSSNFAEYCKLNSTMPNTGPSILLSSLLNTISTATSAYNNHVYKCCSTNSNGCMGITDTNIGCHQTQSEQIFASNQLMRYYCALEQIYSNALTDNGAANNVEAVFNELRINSKYLDNFVQGEMEPADILLLSREELEQLLPPIGPRVRLIHYLLLKFRLWPVYSSLANGVYSEEIVESAPLDVAVSEEPSPNGNVERNLEENHLYTYDKQDQKPNSNHNHNHNPNHNFNIIQTQNNETSQQITSESLTSSSANSTANMFPFFQSSQTAQENSQDNLNNGVQYTENHSTNKTLDDDIQHGDKKQYEIMNTINKNEADFINSKNNRFKNNESSFNNENGVQSSEQTVDENLYENHQHLVDYDSLENDQVYSEGQENSNSNALINGSIEEHSKSNDHKTASVVSPALAASYIKPSCKIESDKLLNTDYIHDTVQSPSKEHTVNANGIEDSPLKQDEVVSGVAADQNDQPTFLTLPVQMRGRLLFYNSLKGFGFIGDEYKFLQTYCDGDIYCNRAGLLCDQENMLEGSLVEFLAVPRSQFKSNSSQEKDKNVGNDKEESQVQEFKGEREKFLAYNVKIISSGVKNSSQSLNTKSNSNVSSVKSENSKARSTEKTEIGVVSQFRGDYGFIKFNNEDYYVHKNNVLCNLSDLKEGSAVSFTVQRKPFDNRKACVNVNVIADKHKKTTSVTSPPKSDRKQQNSNSDANKPQVKSVRTRTALGRLGGIKQSSNSNKGNRKLEKWAASVCG